MFQMVMVFIGLSLDNFVGMMHVASRIKGMNEAKFARDAGIFAFTSAAMLSLGYLVSLIIEPRVPDGSFQLFVASQLIIINGILIILRGWFKKNMEEKLDKQWNQKKLCQMAVITNIDTFFVALAFALLGLPYFFGLILSFGVSFLAVMLALNIGYRYGSQFEKQISCFGGILIVLFGFWIMHVSVIIKLM